MRASVGTRVDPSCCGSTSSAGPCSGIGCSTVAGWRPSSVTSCRGRSGRSPRSTVTTAGSWGRAAASCISPPTAGTGRSREVSGPGTRMNDGAADPQGRFWGGSLADDHHPGGGAFYRLDRTGHAEQVLDGLTIPNGVGWSQDGRTMYLVDSGPRVVHAFAFDGERGTIADERVLLTVPEDVGAPDGLTVDAAGDLWIAIYGAGRVQAVFPRRRAARDPGRPGRGDHLLCVRRPRPAHRCMSRRRRRTGRTSSGRRSQRRASSTGSRPGRPVSRPPLTARIRRGGPRSPADRLTPVHLHRPFLLVLGCMSSVAPSGPPWRLRERAARPTPERRGSPAGSR